VGTTRVLTQDRAEAYAQIAENKRQIEELAKRACESHDKAAKEIEDLKKRSHEMEITYTEIKTRLAAVEAMLIKIDSKIK
jgi:phage shock protein A